MPVSGEGLLRIPLRKALPEESSEPWREVPARLGIGLAGDLAVVGMVNGFEILAVTAGTIVCPVAVAAVPDALFPDACS